MLKIFSFILFLGCMQALWAQEEEEERQLRACQGAKGLYIAPADFIFDEASDLEHPYFMDVNNSSIALSPISMVAIDEQFFKETPISERRLAVLKPLLLGYYALHDNNGRPLEKRVCNLSRDEVHNLGNSLLAQFLDMHGSNPEIAMEDPVLLGQFAAQITGEILSHIGYSEDDVEKLHDIVSIKGAQIPQSYDELHQKVIGVSIIKRFFQAIERKFVKFMEE